MKDIPAPVAEALLTPERRVCDVLVARLPYGNTVLRIANLDHELYLDVGDGNGEQRFEPLPFQRAEVNQGGTLEVDRVTLSLPNVELLVQQRDDLATPIGSETTSLGSLVLNGVLDNAECWLYLVNLENLSVFYHSRWDIVGAPDITPTTVTIQLQSAFGRATRPCPQTVLQGGCNNSLYDDRCGVSRADNTVSGSATGGSRTHLTSALAQAEGHFNLGEIEFTGGLNVGATRTIGKHTDDGSLFWARPLQFVVRAADTFTLAPGCDKSWATCDGKYSNSARFRGFPNIPPEEVMF